MIRRRAIETPFEVSGSDDSHRARRRPRFEMRLARELKPNPRNARKRTKREVQRIAGDARKKNAFLQFLYKGG